MDSDQKKKYQNVDNEKLRQEFLYANIPGGMMGGYMEEGFPFYFINDRMLEYLGYAEEAEFVKDIDGLIDNCIYIEDREMVNKQVEEQLSVGNEYNTEYRMKKKDGSLIWVHDTGKQVITEDNRDAIISVCFDITQQIKSRQKLQEKNRQMEDLYTNIPAGMCLYRWTGTKLVPISVSKGFSELHGIDGFNLMDNTVDLNFTYVHPDDLAGLQKFILEGIKEPGVQKIYRYRIWNAKKKEYIWLQNSCIGVSQEDGSQLIYSNYMDVTSEVEAMDKSLQNEQALKQACAFAGMWTFTLALVQKECIPDKHLQEAYNLPAVIHDFPESLLAMGLIHPGYEESYRHMIADLSSEHPVTKVELQVRNLDGGFSWMRYNWHITEYEDAIPKTAIGYARFIDKEKQQQNRLDMERKKLLGSDKKLTAYSVFDLKAEDLIECKDYLWKTDVSIEDTLNQFVEKVLPRIAYESEKEIYKKNHSKQFMLDCYHKGITSWEHELRFRDENGYIHWQCNVQNIVNDPETDTPYLYDYLYDIHGEKLLEEFIEGTAKTEYEMIGTLAFDTRQFYTIGAINGSSDFQMEEYESICEKYIQTYIFPEDQEAARKRYNLEHVRMQLENNREGYRFIERCKEADGTIHYKKITFSRLHHTNDACFYNRRDISETIRKEEQVNQELRKALREAEEATRAKSQFLSRMSHELRTPLNAIHGYAAVMEQSLEQDTIDKETLHSSLDSILRAGKYQMSIIGDLLDIQRIETGNLKIVEKEEDFSGYMCNILDMMRPEADKRNITFTYENKDEIRGRYLLDGTRFQQILLNLLHNAMKFTPAGGNVNLSVEKCEENDSISTMKFIVSDTGIGMSETFQKNHLFQSFAQEYGGNTSPYEGCGTGLAISKEIIELMGGRVSCKSVQGEGSVFTVILPIKHVKKRRRRERKQYPTYDLSGIKVLLCEDNPMNQDMERRILEKMKCKVDIADDGCMGVQCFEESVEHYYDIIFMDIRMPNMDGLEAAKTIRSLKRKDASRVPILAISANAFASDVSASLEAGMNEHLSKPVDVKLLYSKIKKYCEQ